MRTSFLAKLAVVAAAAALTGCATDSPSSRPVSDHGQFPRGPISEADAATYTAQLQDAYGQRSNMAASLRQATNPDDRRKLQQAVFDYDQTIRLLENRLRSAGRPLPR